MRTVRRLIYRDVVWSVVFVAVAFLSLFFFIDFLDELEGVGKRGFTMAHAALAALFELPGRFYELFPIAVLIGTIYAMARLAQSSEFTILRTGGLSPGRALQILLSMGLVMGVLTFLMGEYAAPLGEQQAAALKARFRSNPNLGRTGAWLKERQGSGPNERSISINVQRTGSDGLMHDVRIFEHDTAGVLVRRLHAATANATRADGRPIWQLTDVRVTEWPSERDGLDAKVVERKVDRLDWATTLEERVVAAAVSPIKSMSTVDLWRYSRHLELQEQAAQRYELQFWRRAFYPLACIVMVALALPFAYLHARAGGVSLKVFGGIMLGISFVLLNNVVGHVGLLRDWTPWVASALPSLLYMLMSLAAFTWLVRYR